MNYLEEKEQQLRAALQEGLAQHTEEAWNAWADQIVGRVRDMVLESYRNGQSRNRSATFGHRSALAAGKLKPAAPTQ